jgi:hypothetical protein
MRGHRLSLVWLGYSLHDLRPIRSGSVGAETGYKKEISDEVGSVIESMCNDSCAIRLKGIVARYAHDLVELNGEFHRVLKKRGVLHVVIGNSNIAGTEIDNAAGFAKAASHVGFVQTSKTRRQLPLRLRYLPVPANRRSALGRRMRFEYVLSFKKSRTG